jgi:hypothetical protein
MHPNEAEPEPTPATGRVNVLREQSAAVPLSDKCDLAPLREVVSHFDSLQLAAACGALALYQRMTDVFLDLRPWLTSPVL